MKYKPPVRPESCSLSTYLGYLMNCGHILRGFSLLVWILWLTVYPLAAQPKMVLLHEFTDIQGLPNNQFRSMLQDRTGILWMAGDDGLARYDGYQFRTYRHSNADTTSLSGNNISRVFEDSKGRLWVSVFGSGINLSNAAKSTFRQIIIPGLDTIEASSLLVSDFAEDSLGRIWVSCNIGLLVLEQTAEYNFSASDIPSRVISQGCAEIWPRSLFVDSLGNVWIGSSNGLYHFDGSSGAFSCPSAFPELPASTIQMIRTDRTGRIWLSSIESGPRLYYLTPGNNRFEAFHCIPFNTPNRGVQFTFDLDNRIWLTEFGEQIYGYDFRDSTLFLESTKNSSVPFERFVRNPVVDHSGNVWLHGAGYLIYPYPKGFRNYLHPFTFHQSNTAVYPSEGNLWLGYREHGMVKLDMASGHAKHFSAQQDDAQTPADHIAAIVRLRSGNMLLVGFDKLGILDHGDRLIRSFEASGTNRAALQDSKGRIWIGAYGGLLSFSESEGILDTFLLPRHIGDPRQFIQSIVEDKKGYLWIASDLNGLARFDPATGEIIQFLPERGDMHSLRSSSVDHLAIDRRGILWAATDVALIRIDPETFELTAFDKSHGFESDYICAVVCDPEGRVWVSTYAGISSFDPETHIVHNYNIDDGLLNRSYYNRSGYCDADGTIYFGGNNGVDYFHPGNLRPNPTAPKMILEGVTIDNAEWIPGHEIQSNGGLDLSYRNDFIEVAFTGLFYSAPEGVQYFYRMDGLGNEWINIGPKHTAVFTDLKPGDYIFRVKAVSPDEVWSEQELQFTVTIAPPFFQTLWFRLIVVAILAAILIGVVRFRELRIARRQKAEAEIARKISELEKRALQAQMNPHFIYNCMNSIQQFMVIHDFEGAMKYLTRFSRILRAVLNMSASSRVALSDELKLIEDYLELENMRFPDKFSYEISVDPELNIHTVEIPPFFIQPQVENAIRHGLLKKGSHGHLSIRIGKEQHYVKVTVEDNGIGREASGLARKKDTVTRESKGLAIVEERLSHLHQANGMHPFRITDLYNEMKEPSGTRVEVFLPLDT